MGPGFVATVVSPSDTATNLEYGELSSEEWMRRSWKGDIEARAPPGTIRPIARKLPPASGKRPVYEVLRLWG